MPKLTATAEEIKGFPLLPEGMYTVRLDGFKPKFSKDRGSVNTMPILKIINHPEFNDQQVFENLNTKAPFMWADFCHAFGVDLVKDASGGVELPGNFEGPADDPSKWVYSGPLLGQVGQLYVIQSEYNGKQNNKIKFYVCRWPGCSEKHSSNLAK